MVKIVHIHQTRDLDELKNNILFALSRLKVKEWVAMYDYIIVIIAEYYTYLKTHYLTF